MHPLVMVLVVEPGRDTRALPGFFYDQETAIAEHVSFTDYPAASRFLIVGVLGQVSAGTVAAAHAVPPGVHGHPAVVTPGVGVVGQQKQGRP